MSKEDYVAAVAAARSAIKQKIIFMLRPAGSRRLVEAEEDVIAAATASRLRLRLR